MARIVREEEYELRRNEILDAAQKLLYLHGYERVSIQDILNELNISKGAFYHYFDSKQELLEGLITRIQSEVDKIIRPIVEDPNLTALEKFRMFFDTTSSWKTARKDYMLTMLRVWYDDQNAIFRQKVYSNGLKWMSPLLSDITRQGICEGTLNTPTPDQVGEILFALFQGMGDTMAAVFLNPNPNLDREQQMKDMVDAYSTALERVLGAPAGSLALIDEDTIRTWLSPTRSGEQDTSSLQTYSQPSPYSG